MKFVIALLIANTSALKLRQMDAPAPIPTDIAFAGSFSDSPISAGFVQISDPAAELGPGAPAAPPAPAAPKAKKEKKEPERPKDAPNVAEAAKQAVEEKAEKADPGAAAAKDAAKAKAAAPPAPAGGAKSPKAEAAAKAAEPIVEAPQEKKGAETDAVEKEAKLKKMQKEHAEDMKSNAAIWAGSGAPPPLTAGDVAVMAAPRPGFDPSLNPGAPNAVESSHTTATAKAEDALKKSAAKATLAQGPKADAQAKAAKTKAEVAAKGDAEPKSAPADAKDKEDKLKKMQEEHHEDMKSNAAIWAGNGAPPPLTAGDIATMAAPRPGFDPSLNPNGDAVESSHTTATAAAEAALNAKPKEASAAKKAPAAPAAPAKK